MDTAVFFLVLLTVGYCRANSMKLGVITRTSHTKVTLDSFGHSITLEKHVVDTSEIYQVYRAVQTLDRDSSVDTIVFLDDTTLHKQTDNFLVPKNKDLIRWVLNDGTSKQNKQKIETNNNTFPDCFIECDRQKTFHCRTDLNSTISHGDFMLETFIPEAVFSPVISLLWKYVIIFYETSTEYETSQLVDMLSLKGVMFVMFNVEHVPDLHELFHRIYNKRVDNEPINSDMNFIVLCKIHNTRTILQTANNFDQENSGRSTLLKKFSRWLVVGYDYCKCVYDSLRDAASDLDNVAVIAIPKETRTTEAGLMRLLLKYYFKGIVLWSVSQEDFYLKLNTIIYDVSRQVQQDANTNFVGTIIKVLQEETKSACMGYIIDTLLWTMSGRDFNVVGYVATNGEVVLDSDIFPNINYGYNKREFLVATLPYPPFVIKHVNNGTAMYEGFCIDLLQELSHILNFTFTIMESPDGLWGDYASKENFTFNGLVGQLQRKEIDITAAPLSEQPERHQVMDFSYPFFYEYTTVVVKKPNPYATKWRKLLDPLKWKVLLSIGMALVVISILAFLMEKWNPYYSVKDHAKKREEIGGLHTWHSAFWYMYGALLCQGGVHLPSSITGRTIVSFWWLFCIIIVGTYCGNLIAFLTVTKEVPPFNTLAEMAELKDDYKWGTLGATGWEMILRTSTNPTFRAVGDSMIEFSRSDPDVLNTSVDVQIDKVMEGNYAWIGDKTSIELAMVKECSLMTTKEMFMPMSYAFGFINNSPHGPVFSQHMMKIHEGGLLQIWKQKWWPKANFCSGNTVTEAKPISLEDVQSAFYVCCIGIVFGLIVLLFENVLHKYQNRVGELKVMANHKDTQSSHL